MRPISLHLEGFTSFRKAVSIDFSQFDLFAITGPTGAGKTSLLDAIIFALYGRTPRLGAEYKALLSQGSVRMSVCLEFQAGGTGYKVFRSLRRGSSAQVRLERQQDGNWIPLADSVRGLESMIERIVGLDFDGFTRAVILPQGAFDQFLRGDARKRRQILVELLQLSVYERMATAANSKAKTANEQATIHEAYLAGHFANATPENLDALREKLAAKQSDSECLTARLAVMEKAHEFAHELKEQRKAHLDAAAQAEAAGKRAAGARIKAGQVEQELKSLAEHQQVLDDRFWANPFREDRYLELMQLEPQVKRAGELTAAVASLKKSLDGAGKEIAAQGHAQEAVRRLRDEAKCVLEAAEKSRATAEAAYEQSLKTHGSPDALEQTATELDKLPAREAALNKVAAQMDDLKRSRTKDEAALMTAKASAGLLHSQVAEQEDHLEHMQREHAASELRAGLKKGDNCPVCEQVIPKALKAGSRRTLDKEKQVLLEARKSHQSALRTIAELETGIAGYEKQFELIEQSRLAHLKDVEALRSRRTAADPRALATTIRKQEQAVRQARAQEDKARNGLSQAESAVAQSEMKLKVSEESHAGVERQLTQRLAEIAGLESQLANWSADDFAVQKRAKADRENLQSEIGDVTKRIHKLELDRATAAQEVEVASEKQKLFELGAQTAAGRVASLAESIRQMVDVPPGRDESDFVEHELEKLRSGRQALDQELGALATEIVKLDQDIQKATDLRAKIAGLKRQFDLYRDLGNTLKGNNFIEFLLGQAMERLAEEGSRHLRRLSSDRYAFAAIESSFSVIDQWNADELRPVATLSGGESFLASLALALSLSTTISQLSANHQKLTLESLFLDEGFSTLDPEALDTVVSAIENLSGGDRLVGVISHIPELAMRLPVQVQVHKSIGGSSVEISGLTPQ